MHDGYTFVTACGMRKGMHGVWRGAPTLLLALIEREDPSGGPSASSIQICLKGELVGGQSTTQQHIALGRNVILNLPSVALCKS